MKLEPIRNPHDKVGQVTKKTKAEEKDELIEKTKKATVGKYGVQLLQEITSFNRKKPLERSTQISPKPCKDQDKM